MISANMTAIKSFMSTLLDRFWSCHFILKLKLNLDETFSLNVSFATFSPIENPVLYIRLSSVNFMHHMAFVPVHIILIITIMLLAIAIITGH